MRKKLILILSIVILGCANNKEQVSTIKIKDEKAQKISEMMEGYVDNNFDSSIISDDAIIKFNKIEMTKTGFKDLVTLIMLCLVKSVFRKDGWRLLIT